MTPELFKYITVTFFVLITFILSFIGMKKTKDFKSFSIGNKDMNPYLIGITMAASISSTATFVINPGFVYVHGLSAYLHYGVAASLGILVAFLLLTRKFRHLGDQHQALTIPHWIYHRYQNKELGLLFAFLNLLSITFVVLILVGCSLLLSTLFPISQTTALTITLLFVFSYVLIGGSYVHAYTNGFQGLLMVIIALFLFFNGLPYFSEGFFTVLNKVGEHYAMVFNPDSNLYFDFLSVFVSGFIITFALMLQPHILTKVLYLKDDKDVNKFIATTFFTGLCFGLILFVGFYAKIAGLDIVRQDRVVTEYILFQFGQSQWGQYLLSFITITLLAAGLSTLDGILVALSSMIVNDIYFVIVPKKFQTPEKALTLSRIGLILIGLISYVIALNPPKLVGIFAQKGVYGLAAASFIPITVGTLLKKSQPIWVITLCAISGLISHLVLNLFMGVANPAVSSTYAIFISTGLFFISKLIITVKSSQLKLGRA